ncbi:excalibur calcium-binding domain-containing protein [Streptomyces marincola]|nr:excalibur calcium-binding domain-containing protein [Streptomyces marincola]
MIITALVLFSPVGIVLTWLSRWPRQKKIVATVLSAVWFLYVLGSAPSGEEGKSNAAEAVSDRETPVQEAPEETEAPPRSVPDYTGQNLADARAAASDSGYATLSHDATEGDAGQWDDGNWVVCFQTPEAGTEAAPDATIDFAVVRDGHPCPEADGLAIEYPPVPGVITMTYSDATDLMSQAGLADIEADSAYSDVELPEDHRDWVVCFQNPHGGEEVRAPEDVRVLLSLTEPRTECPDAQYAELRPEPPPVPTPSIPDPIEEPEDEAEAPGSAYYENCDAVRAAGQAPLYRGEPGYRSGLDRDDDGIACET